jgi:hypothetical protein
MDKDIKTTVIGYALVTGVFALVPTTFALLCTIAGV